MESGVPVAFGVVRTLSHAVFAEIISKGSTRTVLSTEVRCVLSKVCIMVDLDTVLVDWISKCLRSRRVLAIVPAESTVVVSVANRSSSIYPTLTARNTSPCNILTIGVDLDWTQIGAKCGCRVSIVAHIANLNADLVDLAAKIVVGAS